MLLNLKAMLFLEVLILISVFAYRWALKPILRYCVGPREIAVMGAFPVALFLAPNSYVIEAFLILIVAMVGRTRTDVAGLYMLLLPMMPSLIVPTSVGGVYLFQFSTTVALGLGGFIGMMARPVRGRLHDRRLDAVAIVLVMLFTFIDGRDGDATNLLRALVPTLLSIGMPYFIVSRAIGSERDAREILTRLYLAAFVSSGVALFEVVRHWSLYEQAGVHLRIASMSTSYLNIRGGFMRAAGPVMNSSAFAFFVAIILVGLTGVRDFFHKSGRVIVVAILLLALVAAQSRGAWLGACAGYVILCLYRGYARTYVAVAAGSALYVAASLLPRIGRLAEVLGRSGAAAETGEYRRLLLQAGLGQIRNHPWIGQSGPRLVANLTELVQGQGIVDFVNSHLYIAMAAGLIGIVAWLGIWTLPLGLIWQKRTDLRRRTSAMWLLPLGFLSVGLVTLLFTSLDRNLAWLTVALALTSPLIALGDARRSGSV